MRETSGPLSDLATALAVSAVEVQQTLDHDRDATLARLSDGDVELLTKVGLGSLAAPSLRVTDFRVAAHMLVKVSRGTELAITVRPVNLGFRITHQSTQEQESRIEICVNREPLPGGSLMKSEEHTKGESK